MVKDITPNFIHSLREVDPFINNLIRVDSDFEDLKCWILSPNGCFTVKSFYNFVTVGGIHCHPNKAIWKGFCRRKVKAFTWLTWDNKILTLEDLAKRKWNKLPTTLVFYAMQQ